MTHYSLLDLVPVVEGGTVAQALAQSADLAAHAETLGFTRFWVAEHHGMKGIASAATAVVIGHIAAATKTMRVGAGGIMLPNHSPLVIAEQFGTLESLYPGRIDLGLGRAPGSDQRVMHAIRRTLDSDPNGFVRDIAELQSYFADDGRTGISATPGAGADVRLYILGSSLYGAQVAALLGLPYAFASHFAPQMLDEALHVYRSSFKPSAVLDKPYVMAAMNVIAADSDAEAEYLASSIQQSFVALRTGNPRQMQPPVEGYKSSLPPHIAAMLDELLSCSAIGAPDTIEKGIAAFVERTQADEIIVACSLFDHEKRKRSLELTAAAFKSL
ncbi:MAG: LLM class flavin-dependent oxidoreductase [Sphingomonadales bacterium]|nr:LLM class flavin-dependent oxidoreductase [Sphingomonadales bacterium]